MLPNESFSAKAIRKTILQMAFSGQTAHIGCSLSLVEILAVLYRNHLKLDGLRPDDPRRNYLILSKGHGVMALYACLQELGWVHTDDIQQYFKNGTRLKGLGDAHVPGVEVTAGSLGHGLSVGVGMALAAKRRKTAQQCYAIIGDGEMNEGTIWEAILFASQHQLDNLCIIVDENKFQAMGLTEDVMSLGNIQQKLESFGCDCVSLNGHDEIALDQSLTQLMGNKNGRPKAIVAATVKGKGIPFMENDNSWHYKRLNADTYALALKELG